MHTNRYIYMDILKFIAACMIVAIHFSCAGINFEYTEILSFNILKKMMVDVCSIGVPLFFLVNGALLLNKDYNYKKILRKTAKLFIQFVFWSCITVFIIAKYNNIDLLQNGKIFFTNQLLFGSGGMVDVSHYWFIRVLICIYFFYPFIKHCYDNRKEKDSYFYIFLIILAFFSLIIPLFTFFAKMFPSIRIIDLSNLYEFFPLNYPIGTMMLYFIVGGLLQNNLEKIKRIKFIYIIIAFILSLVMLEFDWYISSSYNGSTIRGVYTPYNSLPVMIMCISIFIIIFKINEKIKFPKFIENFISTIGNNTITIYYLNWILGYTLMPKIIEILILNYHFTYGVWFNLLRTIIIVVICGYFGKLLGYIPIIKKIVK